MINVNLLYFYSSSSYWYRQTHNLHGNDEEGLDVLFFINGSGGEVDRISFNQFSKITGWHDFTSHLSRRMYATWMVNQNSMQLREFAAFAASHSQQVQKATYLGSQSKRMASLVADTIYHSNVQGDIPTKITISS